MTTRTSKQGAGSAPSGRQSSQEEQQTNLSNQNPSEGRRDLGHDRHKSQDANTSKGKQSYDVQKTKLSTDEPAEGDRRSAEE